MQKMISLKGLHALENMASSTNAVKKIMKEHFIVEKMESIKAKFKLASPEIVDAAQHVIDAVNLVKVSASEINDRLKRSELNMISAKDLFGDKVEKKEVALWQCFTLCSFH